MDGKFYGSGSKGKQKTISQPWFKTDPETGKLIPLPRPDLWVGSESKLSDKKSSEKKTRKKLADLKPLVFTAADFEEPEPKKKRKLDLGSASKPQTIPKRTSGRISSISTFSKNSKKSLNMKKPTSEATVDKSPLINLDEVEDELIKTNSALKVAKKFNFTKETRQIVSTPSRMSVISEEGDSTFALNELKCMETPSSSNEPNLQNDKIDIKIITDIIEDVIKKQEDAFKEQEKAFAQFTKVHQENMTQLRLILNMNNVKSNGENGRKLLTTPNSTKENLRKKVLQKNLQNDVQSPRTRSALSLYNSLRPTNPVLETPRLGRTAGGESPGKFLSDALMKQCLLLQATPVRK